MLPPVRARCGCPGAVCTSGPKEIIVDQVVVSHYQRVDSGPHAAGARSNRRVRQAARRSVLAGATPHQPEAWSWLSADHGRLNTMTLWACGILGGEFKFNQVVRAATMLLCF